MVVVFLSIQDTAVCCLPVLVSTIPTSCTHSYASSGVDESSLVVHVGGTMGTSLSFLFLLTNKSVVVIARADSTKLLGFYCVFREMKSTKVQTLGII